MSADTRTAMVTGATGATGSAAGWPTPWPMTALTEREAGEATCRRAFGVANL
jgi:hypothetical protein